MRILAVSEFGPRSDGSVDQGAQLSAAGRILDDLYKRGILQNVYLRKDRPGTVLVLECGTEEDAHQYMQSLPGVLNGTTSYQLILLGSEVPPNAFLGARMAGS